MNKRCINCNGTGQLMGGGMMMVDCHHCQGSGSIIKVIPKIDYQKAKETKSYKNAKSRIKKADKSLSDEDAEKILDEELGKEIGAA